jgi:hypothetical protein
MKENSRDLFTKVDDFLTEKLKGYDELKNVVTQGLPAHLANDLSKLKKERDKVLQRLGEQTFQLLSQGKLIVPGIVQATYRTAQEIIERISRIEMDSDAIQPEPAAEAPRDKAPEKAAPVKAEAKAKPAAAKPVAAKPAQKKPAGRAATKPATKKASKKAAKKPAKKVAKKAAKKPVKKPAAPKKRPAASKKVAKKKK